MKNHAWVLMHEPETVFFYIIIYYLFCHTADIHVTILRAYKAKEYGNYDEET